MKRFGIIVVGCALLAPAKIFACATCYSDGAPIDDRMADGMNWAIFTLGAVIATVLGAFLTFLVYAIRKSEAVEAARAKAAAVAPQQLNFALEKLPVMHQQKLNPKHVEFA